MGSIVNAAIPFFVGVFVLLVGFRVIGGKPGQNPKFDEMLEHFGILLKVCGLALMVLAVFFLVNGSRPQ